MLSVATVKSAGGAANYYTQEDNYYFLGEQSTSWFGKGAEYLALQGAVDKSDFRNVLEGKLPDGSDLSHIRNGENTHRAAYEYVFSAPKSVSLLALVQGDKNVLEAHKNAVNKVMVEIESLASTRLMENGLSDIQPTKNIVAALFMHDTSRNLDPQLHTHAIIANVTFDEESGKFKTLSSDKNGNTAGFVETTWNNKIALGKLYRSFLKEELAQQGFEFETVGKNGLWEIKGFSQEVLKEFSSRRQEILEAARPEASQKSLTVTALETRQEKDFTNREQVQSFWQEKWQALMGNFDAEKIKVTAEATQERQLDRQANSKSIDEALPSIIQGLAKEKVKFSRAEIIDKIVDKVYFSGGGFSELVSDRIDQFIVNKELIATDKQQNYFTTAEHLKLESVTTSLIAKLEYQSHQLKSITQSNIALQVAANQKNFNLFNLQGRAKYDSKIVSDIQTMAEENDKQHIILVPSKKDKFNLREQIGNAPFVYIISDYLKSEYADKGGQILTFFRSEKMPLDMVSSVFTKAYTQQNTAILLDTGGRNQKGLVRDLAIDLGIKDNVLKENEEKKSVVIMSGIDRNEQLDTALKAYINLAVNKKNVVMQISQASNMNTNLREKLTQQTREELVKNGLLGTRTATILSKEPVFIKRDENGKADYQNASNYQKGDTIERVNKGKIESWTILSVDRRNKSITVENNATGQKEKPWAMSKMNSSFDLYRSAKDIELRLGEKLYSTDKTNEIRANQNLIVVDISKPNLFFKQKITLEDEKGRQYKINAGEETKLTYGYVESVGRSQDGKRDVIISVLQDNQTNNKTLADIRRGGDRVLAITATSESVLANRIDVNRGQISVTKGLEKLYEAQSLSEIKEKSMQEAIDNPQLKKMIDNRIEALQASKGNWLSFSPMQIISSFSQTDKFTREEVTKFINQQIASGNYLPVSGKNSNLFESFYLKEAVDTEKHLIALMDKGVNTQEPILPNARELLEKATLNQSQKDAAEIILTNQDRIVNLQGFAGVGKTYQLNTVAGLINTYRSDITIKALAPTHKAKEELLKGNAIKDGDTFANFLLTTQNDNQRFDNTLFIIDESSMIGNKTGTLLLNTIVERGGRIILSGDHTQLSALESGDVFRLGQEFSVAKTALIDQIVRQTNPKLLKAVQSLTQQGNVKPSINRAMRLISEQKDTVERVDHLYKNESAVVEIGAINKGQENNNEKEQYNHVALDYATRTLQEQAETQIITASNRHRIGINNAIQEKLSENGQLKNGAEFSIYRRENASAAELKDAATWKENVGNTAKIGNHYFKIQSVSENGEVWLENTKGQQRMLNVADSDSNTAIFKVEQQQIFEGDLIRINATDKDKTVENSAVGKVVSIENDVIKANFNGQLRTLNPTQNEADRHFDLGYAMTTMASQGGSFKNIILFIDTDMKNFIDLKNAYVDISRVKEHLQMYISDVKEYIELVNNNSGVRMTAFELDREHYNAILDKAQNALDNAQEVKTYSNYSERFGDNILAQNGHLNLHAKETELLLPTIDEKGNYTGNLVFSVNPYRGDVDLSNVRLDATEEARFVVLNQGDITKDVEIVPLAELERLNDLKLEDDKTIIIALDTKDNAVDLSEIVNNEDEQIAEQLLIAESKELDSLEKELNQEAEREITAEIKDKENEKDTSEASNKLGRDEVNILEQRAEEEVKEDRSIKVKELV